MRRILLGLVIVCLASLSAFAQTDSLGIEKEGDRYFVIHKVMSGQTLFSLAQRYGTSVDNIKAKNTALANGLKVGQTLKIPYGKSSLSLTAVSAKTHTVSTGETLFSISQKYNVSVDAIKRLNGLKSNALAIGQVLKVSEGSSEPKPKVEVPKVEVTEPETSHTTENPAKEVQQPEKQVTSPVTNPVAGSNPKTTNQESTTENYNGSPFEEIVEQGQAELIDEDEPSTKFLALHKTAKVGTVIKVRNRMNDLTVYVRVVGEIPATADNENIVIKLNKRAYDQLKALDKRFLVELSYFQ